MKADSKNRRWEEGDVKLVCRLFDIHIVPTKTKVRGTGMQGKHKLLNHIPMRKILRMNAGREKRRLRLDNAYTSFPASVSATGFPNSTSSR